MKSPLRMNFNIRAPKTIRVESRYRFSLDSKIGIPTSELWETLIAIVDKFDKDASSRLNQIREDSITAFNYGPSIANLIDHHGLAIREAGSAAEIRRSARCCGCKNEYPELIDPKVGRMRTMDTSIFPGKVASWLKRVSISDHNLPSPDRIFK